MKIDVMSDSGKRLEMPAGAFKFFTFFSLILAFALVLSNDIPLGDVHAILNTYIIIEIAIISVGFIGMSLKQNGIPQKTYNNMVGLVGFSSICLCLDVLAYFMSFLKSTSNLESNIYLAMMTWFTFVTLFMLIMVFLDFMPEIEEEEIDQPKMN